MTALDIHVSPLGRVEGDLDVRVTVDDGVVTSAWTEAAMFRGFEIILRGKDPHAGLIVTPRICGICGGSHLYKSAYALDTAWRTQVPANATLVRNIAQACETLQSIPRYFYALFAIDLTNKNYAKSTLYDEAVRRFAPYVGTAYQEDVLAWVDENESQYNSDCGFFIRYCLDIGLDKYGAGVGNYFATGTYFDPSRYERPTIEGRNDALIGRSGVYAGGKYYQFDQANVREDVTHSYFEGSRPLHPFDGETIPVDPEKGKAQGKYSWAKSPRYEIDGLGSIPLEAGPLARRMAAAGPNPLPHQDNDPLFLDIYNKIGPSVMVRQLARMHEGPKYYKWAMEWLSQLDLKGSFYTKPTEHASGKGFGSTEAARGALSDWIVIEDNKIKNYQVVTPTAWNIGPRDGKEQLGPIEQALVGSPIVDPEDPVELGHVARSFDSCLVCTVHAYDGKTGRELSKFVINGMV